MKLFNKIFRKKTPKIIDATGEHKVTLSGRPPEKGSECLGAPAGIDPKTNMHKDYWVLSKEERAKGFIRPVREEYTHLVCGTDTRMNLAIAETYARNPKFYGSTYCVHCKNHFPVGENGQFVWKGTKDKVGV